MKLEEFYNTIERNSEPGAVLVFYDKYNSNTHYTDENRFYKWRGEVKKKVLTITIFPADDGNYLYRDGFLDYVDRMMRGFQANRDTKVQVILVDQDGRYPTGYLTDNMWSHMYPDGYNTFAFDNPVPAEEMDRTFFQFYMDQVMNGSMLNGN